MHATQDWYTLEHIGIIMILCTYKNMRLQDANKKYSLYLNKKIYEQWSTTAHVQ